jgi:hypothetical protein
VLQLAQLRVGRRGRDEQKGRKEEKREPTQTWWGFDPAIVGTAIAVAARVASDAAAENFMAMEGVRPKIDSVYEKENRKPSPLVGKQWPSSGRPLYALIQGSGSAAHCRQNAPFPQPPAALRCSEEHRIPVEHRVSLRRRRSRALRQQKSSRPVSSPSRTGETPSPTSWVCALQATFQAFENQSHLLYLKFPILLLSITTCALIL